MRNILYFLNINDSNTRNLNLKLFYIGILNALDGILTFIGVSNNYTVEVNKLMVFAVSNFYRMLIFKLLLPSLVLVLVAYLVNRNHEMKMTVAHAFINLCFYIYIFILFTHIIWIMTVVCKVLL